MNQRPCDCCEGIEVTTPVPIANRPGLDALVYRVGTHATFFESMKAKLGALVMSLPDIPVDLHPLEALTTRESSDPAIALLDAWATVADVLTFYQERIANEGFLRTMTELRSAIELARLTGYEPRPGVAASVPLVFELQKDHEVEIPAGTRAQNIPGPNEMPQSFETSAPLLAREVWNKIKPRMTQPQDIDPTTAERVYVEGTATQLHPNDVLLFTSGESCDNETSTARRVQHIDAQYNADRTLITLQSEESAEPERNEGTGQPEPVAYRLYRVIERFRTPEAYGSDPAGEMAREVTAILDTMRERIDPAWSDTKLAGLRENIETWAAGLGEYRAVAEARGYTRLSNWLGDMMHEIDPLAVSLGQVPEVAMLDEIALQFVLEEDLLSSLKLLPSVPPMNSLEMLRTNQTIYSTDSDTLPQFLTAFNPALHETFYTAWTNARITLPPKYENVKAMRVKAAPFGHDAPLKPIYRTIGDQAGTLIGYEEWPLVEGEITLLQIYAMVPTAHLTMDIGGMVVRPPFELSFGITVILEIMTLKQTFNGHVTLPLDLEEEGEAEFRVDGQTWIAERLTGESGPADDGSTTTIITGVRISNDLRSFIYRFQDQQLFVDSTEIELDKPYWKGTIKGHDATVQQVHSLQLLWARIEEATGKYLPGEDKVWLHLDREYDGILPGSCIVLERPDNKNRVIHRVEEVKTVSVARYDLNRRVTRLKLRDPWLTHEKMLNEIRDITVYAQPENLILAQEDIDKVVEGKHIEVDGIYPGMNPGRWLIVSGEREIENTSGVHAAELVMLESVSQGLKENPSESDESPYLRGDRVHSTLNLANALAYKYIRKTVAIYGNVVMATHGETRQEVLGSGDGSQTSQQFTLKQKPLTYVSAATPSGIASTLAVRINEVLWDEATNPIELGPDDREYLTGRDAAGNVTVLFGDGKRGRRLPSGAENVRATYRIGIGRPGNVKANTITQLMTRPLGVKGVDNPLAATGGADPETHDDIRQNAPVAMAALDRLVSVSDYADFARSFAGIGKADAVMLSNGHREVIHVTIAGNDDIVISTDSDLFNNLYRALHTFGEPHRAIELALRERLMLMIRARVKVESGYLWEHVEPRVRAALLDAFGFAQRALGQSVYVSEVQTVIQRVRGVKYVDVDWLREVSDDPARLVEVFKELQTKSQHEIGPPRGKVTAKAARVTTELDANTGALIIHSAQLAYLSPDIPEALILTELKP